MVNPFKHPLVKRATAPIIGWIQSSNLQSVGILVYTIVVFVVLISVSAETWSEFGVMTDQFEKDLAEEKVSPDLRPSVIPSIAQTVGAIVCGIGVIGSLRLRRRLSDLRRMRLTVFVLGVISLGALLAYLPTDWVHNYGDLFNSQIGEQKSQLAYYGKLFFVSALILSVPVVALVHFRSSLMDQYLVTQFMTPFTFCLIGFVAIWLIFDLTDNGPDFARAEASFGQIMTFYVVQLPQVVLFIMPATLLLSLLYALSRMSRSNELISMLGSGRSMMRILRPLFLIGAYTSLVCLVFKYDWAPASEGYKEDLLTEMKEQGDQKGKKKKKSSRDSERARGWLYVNEIDKRTWFVSRVPNDLYGKNLKEVVVWQFDEDWKPLMSWRAREAKWFWGNVEWNFKRGVSYVYDPETLIPRKQSWDEVNIPGWRETPWKVVSSAQNPEYLGIPGLSTFLKTNADYDQRALAPFRTNWWYCWAEPMLCLVMVLVAAPLGITYSRRGVLGGVAASIAIFASMYFIRGVLLSMGQGDLIPPFLSAWGTNLIFATVGGFLLFFRAQNREVPTLKSLYMNKYRRRAHTEKSDGAPTNGATAST